MTLLKKRHIELINHLAMENDWVSANIAADRFNISVSTLRRDVEIINEHYQDEDNRIVSKPGLGLKIEKANTLLLAHDVDSNMMNGILKSKRLIGIATDLLSNSPEPVSISGLAEKYYISRSSIVEDLKKVEAWVTHFSLKVVKNHTGTSIAGDDFSIRMALKEIITYSVLSNYQMTDSRIDRFSRVQLVKEFGENNVANCMNIITLIEDELGCSISEPYYTNLFSHLLVTIRRNQDERIILSPAFDYVVHNNKEWQIAEKAWRWLENEYGFILPEIEVSFIYQYIISSGKRPYDNSAVELSAVDNDAVEYAAKLIREVSLRLNMNLTTDTVLMQSLISHVKPMLNRLAFNIVIHNPLREEIKTEFRDVFLSVKKSVERINTELNYPVTSEDEIAYLTVYIQSAIEMTRENLKIILVCSSGIGTSQLLSSRIIRAFPEWEIVDIVSGAMLRKTIASKPCDLIISTIRLDFVDIPIAYVSALFSKNDISRVTECIFSKSNLKESQHVK